MKPYSKRLEAESALQVITAPKLQPQLNTLTPPSRQPYGVFPSQNYKDDWVPVQSTSGGPQTGVVYRNQNPSGVQEPQAGVVYRNQNPSGYQEPQAGVVYTNQHPTGYQEPQAGVVYKDNHQRGNPDTRKSKAPRMREARLWSDPGVKTLASFVRLAELNLVK